MRASHLPLDEKAPDQSRGRCIRLVASKRTCAVRASRSSRASCDDAGAVSCSSNAAVLTNIFQTYQKA